MHFLSEEVTALNQESENFSILTPTLETHHTPPHIVDPVAARIEQVRHASREVRVLRQLVNQSLINQSVGILVLDDEMRVRLVNPTLLRLLGLNEHVTVQGRLVDQVLSALKCPHFPDWKGCLSGVAQGQSLQCEARNVTGGEFLVSISEIPQFGWIINLDSVSTLKAHERERGRLLNFLSHDMRAPQASILALLEQQTARKVVDETLLQDIRRFAQRTLHLISQFMFLARAEHLHAEDFIELDMVQCMHDAIDEVWPQASAQGITIKRPETTESLLVIGNRALLQRALINLISNAVQHSLKGDVVQCDVDQQWGEVCCTVRDTGEGIAEQDQLVLFNSFSRVADPAHPAGTGLGLALVKMVADKHRGRIEVLSQVGHGSTFFFYLNLAPTAIRKPLRSDYSSPLIP
jgi:signal transduction histidine kinase